MCSRSLLISCGNLVVFKKKIAVQLYTHIFEEPTNVDIP